MAASTPEDLVNQALDAIGYPKHIGDMYEGSPASRCALEIYNDTRKQLLQEGDWPFCLAEQNLSLNGQTAPSPWLYEYAYPGGCVRVRYVKPPPYTGGARSNDPQPILFRTWSDRRPNPAVQAILCDVASAVLVFNSDVFDPTQWEVGFTKAFIAALAEKLSFMLSRDANVVKARVGLADADKRGGMTVDDLSAPVTPPREAASGSQR